MISLRRTLLLSTLSVGRSSSFALMILFTVHSIWLTSTVESCHLEMKPHYCNAESMFNFEQPCPMTRSKTIRCQYSKIDSSFVPAPITDLFKVPGPPRSFSLEPYTVRHYESCFQVINFTWTLPFGINSQSLEGFLLNISFVHENISRQILRLFKVSFSNLTQEDLKEVVFYYDCVVPNPKTEYRIELHSLPLAEHEYNSYATSLHTFGDVLVVDANNSASWKSWIWMKSNPDTTVLEFCFSLAPKEFGFSKYGLYLIGQRSGKLRLISYSATVKVIPGEATTCYKFEEVCSDFYSIEIEPEATMTPKCNCKLRGLCTEKCSPSVFENVNMNKSQLSCSDASPPKPPVSSLTEPPAAPPTDNIPLIIGVVVGSLLSILFVSLFGLLLCRRPLFKKPGTQAGTQKKIVILYSNDIEDGLGFIQSLGDFMRMHCSCDVVIDRWLEHRSVKTNVERIRSYICSSDSTVLILSTKVCSRYFDTLRGVIQMPTSTPSFENLAVVNDLIKLTMVKYNDSMRKKCYQVSMTPSTKSEMLLEKVVEQCYELPNDISCFLKTTCGILKLSRKQKAALRSMVSSEKFPDCQPLLRPDAKPLEPLDSVTIISNSSSNNNHSSFGDLNKEEEHSVDMRINIGNTRRWSSSDSAFSTLNLPTGTTEMEQLHSNLDDAFLSISSVTFVPPDDLNLSSSTDSFDPAYQSFLAPSSMGASSEDIGHVTD